MENVLQVTNNQVTISTLVIAEYTEKEHKNLRELIEDNISDFNEFGILEPYTVEPIKGSLGGKPIKFYSLNEQQYSLLMTYLRNNPKIKEFKKNMVKAFFEMKKQLENKSSNQPDLQKVISGLKSGMLRKDKKIEKLENEIQQLKIEHQKRVAIPHFTQNQKIDIILRNTENLLKQDGILPFQDMAKARFDFMRDYIEAIRTGGTKLEQFTINTIEDYKNKYIDESKRRVLVEHKYNLMIERVREYIKVANQLSLLEPIGGAR